jgi:hypothetical protein
MALVSEPVQLQEQQQLGQTQEEFCRPLPDEQCQGGAWHQQCYQRFWRQQLCCWQSLQHAVCLPALWFALVRCYMEGSRIKHKWLHNVCVMHTHLCH